MTVEKGGLTVNQGSNTSNPYPSDANSFRFGGIDD
jgi:hypothetical protein